MVAGNEGWPSIILRKILCGSFSAGLLEILTYVWRCVLDEAVQDGSRNEFTEEDNSRTYVCSSMRTSIRQFRRCCQDFSPSANGFLVIGAKSLLAALIFSARLRHLLASVLYFARCFSSGMVRTNLKYDWSTLIYNSKASSNDLANSERAALRYMA